MKPLNGNQTQLIKEIEELHLQLQEANETIYAIRTGQIDALVVTTEAGPKLFTLKSADHTYRIFIEKMKEIRVLPLCPRLASSPTSKILVVGGDANHGQNKFQRKGNLKPVIWSRFLKFEF